MATFAQKGEMPKSGQVDTHEGEKGSEIEKLARAFKGVAGVVQPDGATVGNGAHDKNVVGRRIGFRVDVSKDLLGEHAVATHAKEEARRPEAAGERTAKAARINTAPMAWNRRVPPTR